jgi:hypothetical protein
MNNEIKLKYEERLKTEEQTIELCLEALNHSPELLKNIDVHTEEIVMFAIQKSYSCFIYSKLQTPEICKYVLNKNGVLIKFIDDQTEDLAEIAVKNNGSSLMFVNNKTHNVCKFAVQEYGCALRHVPIEMQNAELCELALKQNINAFLFVRDDLKKFVFKYDINNYKNYSIDILKTMFKTCIISPIPNILCPLCDEQISQEKCFINFGCKKDHVCCIKCFSEWFPKKAKQCIYCTKDFIIDDLTLICL